MREERLKEPIRVGVVGVGHLGSVHTKLWKDIEGATLVGIYDADRERAEAVAREHDLQSFDDFAQLLTVVDALSIVTPTSTHAEVARRALESGVHCFIEKPITARYEEAGPLITLAATRGLTLQVGHVERFNPAMLALSGHPLAPMFIESHRLAQFKPRATDVAVVHDLMIHDIDLALSLVKSEVTEIRASGVAVISDTIDIANARLEFANGCVANLTASRISQRAMRKMRLFQPDAYISIDFNAPSVEIFRIGDEGQEQTPSTVLLGAIDQGSTQRTITYEQIAPPSVNAIARELEEFVEAIREGSPPPVTAAAAAEALRIAEGIVEAIEKKKGIEVRG
jgi:predicted dehydrogenase